jgi:hypothetical protein
LPEREFDLVHARLVLLHLPQRLAVLDRLVLALKPGGWLQLDDFDETSYGPLISLGRLRGGYAARVYAKYLDTKRRVLRSAGVDLPWGATMAGHMERAGLVDLDIAPDVQPWRHDSAGIALQIHNTHHLRDRFLGEGMTEADLEDARQVMGHPDFAAGRYPVPCVKYG